MNTRHKILKCKSKVASYLQVSLNVKKKKWRHVTRAGLLSQDYRTGLTTIMRKHSRKCNESKPNNNTGYTSHVTQKCTQLRSEKQWTCPANLKAMQRARESQKIWNGLVRGHHSWVKCLITPSQRKINFSDVTVCREHSNKALCTWTEWVWKRNGCTRNVIFLHFPGPTLIFQVVFFPSSEII